MKRQSSIRDVLAAGLCAFSLLALPAKAEPTLQEYSLILPANLPHVMQFVDKLGLAEAQKRALNQYADGEVRPALGPRLKEAQRLEKEIGQAALDGRTVDELAGQIDRLAQLKRESAEIHLRCIERVRATLTREEYARLLALARPGPVPATPATH
jgi:hypothetical protein